MKQIAQFTALCLVLCIVGCISKSTQTAKQLPQYQDVTLVFFDKIQNATHSRPHRIAKDVTMPDKPTLLSQNFRDGSEYKVTYQFMPRSGKVDLWQIEVKTPKGKEATQTINYDGKSITLHETDVLRIELK